jgi:tetratricopeptide (TPR) repeat protein
MKRRAAGSIAIWGATFLAYLPAWSAGFIWNDKDYVTRPALRSLGGLGLIWTKLGATEQYYPLLHSLFWLEHRLWGNSASGYHLVNAALHAASAVLFWTVLSRWWPDRPGVSWLAAMLFALHPVMAESVAWISEQKNTLSLVFYLLAGLSYWSFFERRRQRDYWVGLAWFICALLSKSVTATLPAALLVIIGWRAGSDAVSRHVRPLLPWFVIAAASGLFSAWVEKTYVGAQGPDFSLSVIQRVLLAARIPWFYLAKLAWPAHLVFIYPRWTISPADPVAWIYLCAAVLTLAGIAILGARKSSVAGLAACGLFFAGSLFPTGGFFNVYAFVYSYVADHWDYLPALGIFAGGAWLLAEFTRRLPLAVRGSAAAALLLVLAALTFRQARAYHDAGRFYSTIVTRNPSAWMAQHNLGDLLAERGENEAALAFYAAALRSRADLPLTEYAYGQALGRLNRPREAEARFRSALALQPGFAAARDALARSRLAAGDPTAAIAELNQLAQTNPDFPGLPEQLAEAHNNAGVAALQNKDLRAAAQQLGAALRHNPDYAVAWANLGRVLAAAGRPGSAIAPFEQALKLQPGFAEAENDLGVVFATMGRPGEAIPHYEAALRLRPDYPAAQRNLQLARSAVR